MFVSMSVHACVSSMQASVTEEKFKVDDWPRADSFSFLVQTPEVMAYLQWLINHQKCFV